MNPHLEPAPYPYTIQPPVCLEPPVQPLNSCSLVVDCLPLCGLFSLGDCFLMEEVGVNDRLRSVLPLDKFAKAVCRVPFVADHVGWVEFTIDDPRLLKKRPGLLEVVKIARADVHDHREFGLGVTEDMHLVAPDVFLVALGVGLYAPTGVGVGHLPYLGFLTGFSFLASLALLVSVGPSFNIGAVDSNRLTETREGIVQSSREIPENILDGQPQTELCQPRAESGESWLARYGIRTVESANLGHEGIIVEIPDQGGDRLKAKVVISYVGSPKTPKGIPLRTPAYRATQLS